MFEDDFSFSIATFLDPRCKGVVFSSEPKATTVKLEVIRQIQAQQALERKVNPRSPAEEISGGNMTSALWTVLNEAIPIRDDKERRSATMVLLTT